MLSDNLPQIPCNPEGTFNFVTRYDRSCRNCLGGSLSSCAAELQRLGKGMVC